VAGEPYFFHSARFDAPRTLAAPPIPEQAIYFNLLSVDDVLYQWAMA
jgi:hypothetical protein